MSVLQVSRSASVGICKCRWAIHEIFLSIFFSQTWRQNREFSFNTKQKLNPRFVNERQPDTHTHLIPEWAQCCLKCAHWWCCCVLWHIYAILLPSQILCPPASKIFKKLMVWCVGELHFIKRQKAGSTSPRKFQPIVYFLVPSIPISRLQAHISQMPPQWKKKWQFSKCQ